MIPEYLLAKIEKSDVIYRCIGNEMKNGILACGFMRKETADRSQYHFSNEYYSCFVLLRGSGEYIAEDGTSYPLQAGSLVQRLPDFYLERLDGELEILGRIAASPDVVHDILQISPDFLAK